MKKPSPAQIKTTIVKILKDNKAMNVQALKISELTDFADYIVIATANSNTHAKALANKIYDKLALLKIKPIGIEGEETREWILVDFGDVIVHIMLENIRQFYNLEKLWGLGKIKPK